MSTQIHPPAENDALVQGGGVTSVGKDGQTVTAGQFVAIGDGTGGHIIGIASEAFDAPGGGANPLVGAESAVIDEDDDDDVQPKYGHNSAAKVRRDWMPRLLKRRPLKNAAAYYASAQPDTSWEAGLRCERGSLSRAVIDAPGNPGIPFANLSGDMCEWYQGRLYLPLVIDGIRWGIPLTYLPAPAGSEA